MGEAEADVAVVGSGAAGLRAAIAAREAGAGVVLITKHSPGLGASTLMSHGVFASYSNMEEHARKTLLTGHFRNDPELVRVLSEEAPGRIEELLKRGLKMELTSEEASVEGNFPFLGKGIVKTLLMWSEEVGVKIVPWMEVIKIVTDEGEVAGVVALDKNGHLRFVQCKALILCTGGAGALFRYHDNPLTNLGEGYAIAVEAGAHLKDMEFVQFYPLMVWEGRNSKLIVPPAIVEAGRIVNEDGEEIREKYGLANIKPIAILGRDKLSQAVYRELRKGKQVFFDGRQIREEELDAKERKKLLYLDRKFGLTRRPLKVVPCAHFTIGGVRIDDRGRTNIGGLFASGEVTSGIHGANRMGGNALSETLVFGKRSGEAAASYVMGKAFRRRSMGALSLRDLLKGCTEGRHRPLQFLRFLKEIMWDCCGPIRRKDRLDWGLREAERLSREGMKSQGDELAFALSVRRGLETARIIMEAARKSNENVGAHFMEEV